MLRPEQMEALRKAKGAEFDHLFLTGMIQHHNGALTMVKDLFDTAGAGQDADLFNFATDADNTQRRDQDYADYVGEKTVRGEKMNRVPGVAFRVVGTAIALFFGVSRMQAQEPPKPPPAAEAEEEEDENPFAPEPAPTLRRDNGVGCERSARQADAGAV